MSSPLREHQHELCSLDGTDGIVFGTDDTGYLTTSRPTITRNDARLGDVDRPQEDGIMLGRDYTGSKTYGFEFVTVTDDINQLGGSNRHRANLDHLAALEARWFRRTYRNGPTAFAMLRSCEGGITSVAYGRPRRWDEAAGALTQQGVTPVVADFLVMDGRWYADFEQEFQIPFVQASEGGFVAPIVAPIVTTSATTSAERTLIIGGTEPTWPVVTFQGPVSDPKVMIDDLVVGVTATLTSGQSITVDPRPWQRTVLRSPDGAAVGGLLSGDTPAMRDLMVDPGNHVIRVTGRDITGGGFVRLNWRDARSRP